MIHCRTLWHSPLPPLVRVLRDSLERRNRRGSSPLTRYYILITYYAITNTPDVTSFFFPFPLRLYANWRVTWSNVPSYPSLSKTDLSRRGFFINRFGFINSSRQRANIAPDDAHLEFLYENEQRRDQLFSFYRSKRRNTVRRIIVVTGRRESKIKTRARASGSGCLRGPTLRASIRPSSSSSSSSLSSQKKSSLST